MKILKNAGTFEIIKMPEDAINDIAEAGRICRQSQKFAGKENDTKLVGTLVRDKHGAMLEFADMTVRFDNISRGFTHEMVRHRLCSYAQESTRYVDESDFKCVVPPHKDENEEIEIDLSKFHPSINPDTNYRMTTLKEWFKLNENMYRAFRKAGWKPEDARQVLPIGIKSQIAVKTNLQEWRHIFHMRCDKFAHWEIRGVMLQLLNECKKTIPIIFDDFIFYYGNGIRLDMTDLENLTLKFISENRVFARNY